MIEGSPAHVADGPDFFANLPLLASSGEAFDLARYRSAPGDWLLAVTDIVDSTGAIAKGRHKTVNFAAAMGIAALRNLCAPTPIPFLFGGDGAVIMVPPEVATKARTELARVRGMAARDFGLAMRVGLAPVKELRRLGSDVLVGRYEPTPGNSFGVFLGGGIGLLEESIRGRGNDELAALAEVPVSLDDGAPVDLEGLSCRWDTLHSSHGAMLTLILQGRPADLRDVHESVAALAGPDAKTRPVREETLKLRWPPADFMLEVRARRRGGSLVLWACRVLVQTLIARLLFARGKPTGNFDPQRYRAEMIRNTDFCKFDETVCLVMDCSPAAIEAIRSELEQAASRGVRYGLHVSPTALVTCLVTSASNSLHVHFVDGGSGGYTSAASSLKRTAKMRVAAPRVPKA